MFIKKRKTTKETLKTANKKTHLNQNFNVDKFVFLWITINN
tara:strand:+ start:523 stop:645 length:123 start_codon:yes stop_codon:yes gene_type:complete